MFGAVHFGVLLDDLPPELPLLEDGVLHLSNDLFSAHEHSFVGCLECLAVGCVALFVVYHLQLGHADLFLQVAALPEQYSVNLRRHSWNFSFR